MAATQDGGTSEMLVRLKRSVDPVHTERCSICGNDGAYDLFSAPDRLHAREALYQLLRCPSCSMVWLRNAPSREDMPLHYDTDYHEAITAAGEGNPSKRWQFARNRVLEFKNGGALLDIGCSSGGFLRSIRNVNWELYGVELSPAQAQRAELMSGAKVFVGNILDAQFPVSSFDVITGFHVLEHVYNPKEVIGKVWEWLKPDGILYLHVPNFEALEARMFKSYWYGLELPRHLFHFSTSSLRRLFADFEFDQVLLRTLSHTHIEESLYYMLDDLRRKLCLPPIHRRPPGMAWRIIRKAWRLGLLEPLGMLFATMGYGAGIEILLRKHASSGQMSGSQFNTELLKIS